jgi:hypothetical protein
MAANYEPVQSEKCWGSNDTECNLSEDCEEVGEKQVRGEELYFPVEQSDVV